MSETHSGATWKLESVAEEERARVSDGLSRQEQVDLGMRARGGRHDLQPTSSMRDARDLLPIAEDDGPMVVEPDDLHDLADAGGVRRDRLQKTIGSHDCSSRR